MPSEILHGVVLGGFETPFIRWHADSSGKPYAKQVHTTVERWFAQRPQHRVTQHVLLDPVAFASFAKSAAHLVLVDRTSGDRFVFDLSRSDWWQSVSTWQGERIDVDLGKAIETERGDVR